jgi:hypothetical protein
VASAEPSDQGTPEKERESSEVRGRENELEHEGWGAITVEGEAYDETCRYPGAYKDVHLECAGGSWLWSVNAEVTSWGNGLHHVTSGHRSG